MCLEGGIDDVKPIFLELCIVSREEEVAMLAQHMQHMLLALLLVLQPTNALALLQVNHTKNILLLQRSHPTHTRSKQAAKHRKQRQMGHKSTYAMNE